MMHHKIITEIPGPNSRKIMAQLAQYESPAITARQLARANAGGVECPIVFAKTHDVWVWDVDDNCLMDMTAGFGVASVGHAHPKVVKAAQEQMAIMPHAMGDAFPGNNKVLLLKKLAELAPGNLTRTLLANSGFEAVEVALKTAMIKTKKPGIIAFDNGYHGLGYGALSVSSYRDKFREPFLAQLNPHVTHLPYPEIYTQAFLEKLEQTIKQALKTDSPIGALIMEPILGRGGIVEAHPAALKAIRRITLQYGIVFILDEIYTGFGRTGDWFACEQDTIIPDLLCVGKGMNNGFPISAVIGSDEVMAGWGDARGEAIHTSTFLGNPVGCAMSLACIDVLESDVLRQVKPMGEYFKRQLESIDSPYIQKIRGRGLMLGVEFLHPDPNYTLKISKYLLQKGFIALPCGLDGNVLSLTPPLTIQKEHIDFFIEVLDFRLRGNDAEGCLNDVY